MKAILLVGILGLVACDTTSKLFIKSEYTCVKEGTRVVGCVNNLEACEVSYKGGLECSKLKVEK